MPVTVTVALSPARQKNAFFQVQHLMPAVEPSPEPFYHAGNIHIIHQISLLVLMIV